MIKKENARDGQSRADTGNVVEETNQYTEQIKKASETHSLPHIVVSWPKNRNTLKVIIDQFSGKTRVDIRQWYFAHDGSERPSKGISVPLDQLDRLTTALNLARDLIEEHGIAGQADRR